jgi:hypothetical protein
MNSLWRLVTIVLNGLNLRLLSIFLPLRPSEKAKLSLFVIIITWRWMEEWMYRSTYSYLGTSWRWVVSFTRRPLYHRGKSPLYSLDRTLGGPQSRCGRRGEEKNLSPIGTRTSTPRLSNPQPLAATTTVSRLEKWNIYFCLLSGFSPQANYTDRAADACRRNLCQLFRVEGVACSAQRIPTAVNVGFLDPGSKYTKC